jgi:hypothetical protein
MPLGGLFTSLLLDGFGSNHSICHRPLFNRLFLAAPLQNKLRVLRSLRSLRMTFVGLGNLIFPPFRKDRGRVGHPRG